MSELQSERAREQSDRDRAFFERIMHDEELGEENVEAVDSDWADFERLFREFRERRHSAASIETVPKTRRMRRPKSQNSFYPCPPPSFSEADQYCYSDDDDEEDDDRSTDDDGFMTTLVS